MRNLVALDRTVQTYTFGDSLGRWAIASRLSRSLKVIGTGSDQSATYRFLLVIHSNHRPLLSYRFRDKRRLRSKIANFSPRVLKRSC